LTNHFCFEFCNLVINILYVDVAVGNLKLVSLNHLKECPTYQYTLFHEEIPEDVQLKIRREEEIEAMERKSKQEIKAIERKAQARAEENVRLKKLKEEEKWRAYYKSKYDIVLLYCHI
jgi:hypothetical protein